jgi:hypothetical protein
MSVVWTLTQSAVVFLDLEASADRHQLRNHIFDRLRRVDLVRAGGPQQRFHLGEMAKD